MPTAPHPTALTTGPDRFFVLVAEYRQARAAAEATRPGSAIHIEAQRLLTNLGPRAFTLTLACMLRCNNTFDFNTTIAEYADYRDAPRGICGRH